MHYAIRGGMREVSRKYPEKIDGNDRGALHQASLIGQTLEISELYANARHEAEQL